MSANQVLQFHVQAHRDSLTFVKGIVGMSGGMPYSSKTVFRQRSFGNPARCRQRGWCGMLPGDRPVADRCYLLMRARFAVTVWDRAWVRCFGVTV